MRSDCNYTNTKESQKPGIVACLHWVLLWSFSSHYYALLHFILINLTYELTIQKNLCAPNHCLHTCTVIGGQAVATVGKILKVRKNGIPEKKLLFTFSWKLFCKFWGIFMYFPGSLDMVCKYQPHKINKCELYKAVSQALLISAWLRNLAFCFCMSPQWTLSNNHNVTEGHTFFFLYKAIFKSSKSNWTIESLSWWDEVHLLF